MNKIFNPKRSDWRAILRRPTRTVADIEETVNGIFREVEGNGDAVLKKYTMMFDGVAIDDFLVSKAEIEKAIEMVPDELRGAIQLAKTNIEKFHRAQKTQRVTVETAPGVQCWQEKRPIEKVGLYI